MKVLLSMRGPDGTTKYVDQLATHTSPDVEYLYFTWRNALFEKYDVLHMHWPEQLVRATGFRDRAVKSLLSLVLVLRLWVRRTPVVRTLHNRSPHDKLSLVERRLYRLLEARESYWIRLNEAEGPIGPRETVVLHGDYVERFSPMEVDAVPGRMAYVGLIKRYKGVLGLVEAFGCMRLPGSTLLVAGYCADAGLRREIGERSRDDDRVRVIFDFLSDSEMVRELSSAELVVLPYEEMGNSGMMLVALSLGRPVLVPDAPIPRSLASEVGNEWVIRYSGPLTPAILESALAAASTVKGIRPRFRDRDWRTVAAKHAEIYRTALAGAELTEVGTSTAS